MTVEHKFDDLRIRCIPYTNTRRLVQAVADLITNIDAVLHVEADLDVGYYSCSSAVPVLTTSTQIQHHKLSVLAVTDVEFASAAHRVLYFAHSCMLYFSCTRHRFSVLSNPDANLHNQVLHANPLSK